MFRPTGAKCFSRWSNGGSKMLSQLLKFTEPGVGRAGVQTRTGCWLCGPWLMCPTLCPRCGPVLQRPDTGARVPVYPPQPAPPEPQQQPDHGAVPVHRPVGACGDLESVPQSAHLTACASWSGEEDGKDAVPPWALPLTPAPARFPSSRPFAN